MFGAIAQPGLARFCQGRDKAAPAEPWRGEAAGVGIHGRGTRYNTLQPNMPSKFATRTAWASRGASFSATRPRFPTRREIAIFTPIHAISPRISQILSVFGDNLVVIRRVIGVENAIQHQRFNRCQ